MVMVKWVGLRAPSLKCQIQAVLELRHLHEEVSDWVEITINVLSKIQARFYVLHPFGSQPQAHGRHQNKHSLDASSHQLNKIVSLRNIKDSLDKQLQDAVQAIVQRNPTLRDYDRSHGFWESLDVCRRA